jgi:hypothetical protein
LLRRTLLLMKSLLFACVGLVVSGALSVLHAQPEQDLRDALNRLRQAGNYTWQDTNETNSINAAKRFKMAPRAEGETVVDGFTIGGVRGLRFVQHGRESAFALARGWVHFKDITDTDVSEPKRSTGPTFPVAWARSYVHPLAHEILETLLGAGENFRKESGAIVADVAPTLLEPEMLVRYLRTGVLPATGARRSIFGLPVPRPPARSPQPAWLTGTFRVSLDRGTVTEIEVEFTRRAPPGSKAANEGHAGFNETFRVEILKVGTTTVSIPPEAKALFLGVGAGN